MRIIGGAFRGRRLSSVGKGDSAAHLRPTGDRVRESLFNILASYGLPEGARVLDLFAGTGALGLEALSRGAAQAVFVENGRVGQKLIGANIALCRAEEQARLLARDARRLGANAQAPFDLVFLDPPYGKALGEAALSHALQNGWIASGAMIVWEENGAVAAPDGLELQQERHYGDTVLRFFTRE